MIKCGIGQEQGQKILDILNTMLARKLDLRAVMDKLDEMDRLNASSGVLLGPSSSSPSPIIEIGDSGSKLMWAGPNGSPLLTILEDTSLTVEKVADHFAVSTRLRDATGKMVAEIERNEWRVRPSLVWDRNYNQNSLEVIDGAGEVVLQVVVLTDEIRIQGIWHDKSGRVFEIVKSPDPNAPGGLFVFDNPIKITPIFVYPSDRHLGEMKKP